MKGSSEITIRDFVAAADAGEPMRLLDVRNQDEFEAWRVEARRPVETLHVPYFEFVEDEEASAAGLPRDGRPLVVLCAKGGSSEYVAEVLRGKGFDARNVTGGMIAYGEYLQPVRVTPPSERFELWQFNRRGKGCLSHLVISGGEAVLVDPSRSVGVYEDFARARGASIVRVLDTHIHADHVSGGPRLAARAGIPYFVAAGEGDVLGHPVTPLSDGEQIRLGGQSGVMIAARVVHTPGHTPGSTSYLVDGSFLLSGDTLFVNGVGRPDRGGQLVPWGRALYRTLRERIAALPDETVVLPAHYGAVSEIGADGVVGASLGHLRLTVPEMSLPSADAFIEAIRGGIKSPPEAYSRIIAVNQGLAAADEAKATEWELGKNECAVSRAHAASAA